MHPSTGTSLLWYKVPSDNGKILSVHQDFIGQHSIISLSLRQDKVAIMEIIVFQNPHDSPYVRIGNLEDLDIRTFVDRHVTAPIIGLDFNLSTCFYCDYSF